MRRSPDLEDDLEAAARPRHSEGEGTLEVAGPALEGEPAVSRRHLVGTVLLSVGVLAVIGYVTFDLEAFAAFARDLSPWLLGAALGTVVVRVGFGAWRLRHFSGGRIDVRSAVRDQVVWDFFAYVTPSTVGGGPFTAVFIARDRQLPLGEATSVILFSMLVDQVWFALTIPALLLAATAFDVFPAALGAVGAGALTVFFVGYLVWVAVLAYGTLLRPDRLRRALEAVFRWRPLRRFASRASGAMADLEARSRALRSQSAGFYAKGFAISLVPWLCRYLLAVFVVWSVVPDVDTALVFLRSAALQLGALAVPTPGGAGGVEGLYVLFLGPPLVPEALVAPTLLVWRVLSFYVFIAAGAALVARHVRRRSSSRPSRRPALEGSDLEEPALEGVPHTDHG